MVFIYFGCIGKRATVHGARVRRERSFTTPGWPSAAPGARPDRDNVPCYVYCPLCASTSYRYAIRALFAELTFNKTSLGFELLLAMKHHARRLFITDLQNPSTVVAILDEFRDACLSIAVNNKNIDAVRRMIETTRHMTYHEIRNRHESNIINPTQIFGYKSFAAVDPTQFD
ncbi:hypothetical protein EVAR_24430_1 [Eumeta japonica]|uniref:Uncharacterized protein n=1 Tax=Eumeta variegata TaxID=151549 RepID=A0A4C1VS61_EUMVA|nr:hypothetical protein EVAR_24430_1 [Eumeta japonica]